MQESKRKNNNKLIDAEARPLISVIMGIYNCESTLEDAVTSILSQTVNNYEIIMCDDGSDDGTYDKACELMKANPDIIYVIRNRENKGLACALNRCLKIAKGKYIARMDGDDKCLPNRFETELRELVEHSELSVVSTDMMQFDEDGIWGRASCPIFPRKRDFVYETPFFHAPCMMRASDLKKIGGYNEDKKVYRVEDYDLWVRFYANGFQGKNINKPLYLMRDDRNAFHRRKLKYRMNEAYVISNAVKQFDLPLFYYLFCVKPILLGLMPPFVYAAVHKWRRKNGQEN
ncbi:MAG: glycosyltransferase [Lachnospiraceae bacterium]|nr:glycosyltransferase [Lachnospiraceae bacterium]